LASTFFVVLIAGVAVAGCGAVSVSLISLPS